MTLVRQCVVGSEKLYASFRDVISSIAPGLHLCNVVEWQQDTVNGRDTYKDEQRSSIFHLYQWVAILVFLTSS